jgi:hypothetical protein
MSPTNTAASTSCTDWQSSPTRTSGVDNSGDRAPRDNYPTLRIVRRAMAMMEVNLTLANADFDDFASAVDKDGINRG